MSKVSNRDFTPEIQRSNRNDCIFESTGRSQPPSENACLVRQLSTPRYTFLATSRGRILILVNRLDGGANMSDDITAFPSAKLDLSNQ